MTNFLEIGISNQRGGRTSLLAWKNIFPKAHIYGIDYDIVKMIDTIDGISTFWADQSSEKDLKSFNFVKLIIYFINYFFHILNTFIFKI